MSEILIAPSILSADFSKLGQEIKDVEAAGADWIHVDVMDGHFVPNITIGPLIVKSVKPVTRLPLDVHLMISEPEKYVDQFTKAGSDIITFHIEACEDPKGLVSMIRAQNRKVGVSVKPKTPISSLDGILEEVDLVLIMTVEPGFGGQGFIKEAVPKIRELRKYYKKDLSVDGGIDEKSSKAVLEAGANILVAGTAVFKQSDYGEAIRRLRG